MASKRCPHCGLVNPGKATTCDCGYSFASGAIGAPLDLTKPGAPMAQQPAAYQQASSNLAARFVISLVVTAIIIAIRFALRR